MKSTELYPPLSAREIRGADICRRMGEEGMVLLKNDGNVLPVAKEQPVALFGNGAVRTIRGGTGSGDPFNGGLSGGGDADIDLSPRYHIHILQSMLDAGFTVVTREMLQAYAALYDAEKIAEHITPMDTFFFPEEELTEEKISGYRALTDTAIVVISRNSGEGHDRKIEGDYRLSEREVRNIELVRESFKKLVLVLNIAGPVSVRDLESTRADAILLMGQCGQEGGDAFVSILSGAVSPSGKLSATWGYDYADYPSAAEFLSKPLQALYTEGIYVGYRYFDTFGKKPGYPFGYGLSYTDFRLETEDCRTEGSSLKVRVRVTNTGACAGKEVVQLYVSAPSTELDMPYQELKAYRKTGLIQPDACETLEFTVDAKALSSYASAWNGYILSKGDYVVRIGTSSIDTEAVCKLRIEKTHPVRLVYEELPLQEEMTELSGKTGVDQTELYPSLPVLRFEKLPETEDLRPAVADRTVTTYTTDPAYRAVMPYEQVKLVEKHDWTYQDVLSGKVSDEEFLAQFSAEQLSNFVCGTGWGVSDDANPIVGGSSESVPGAAGETTHALTERYGVPSFIMADGPGGVRISQHFTATNVETGEKQEVYHYCIAWPVGTTIAQSFNDGLAEELGAGIAADLSAFGIGIVLGPGINIHRNPLCGRNFEYFSEDPYLAGKMAAAVTRGVQTDGRTGACIKHYAANNQETNRSTCDSVISQRALREIYLEPFRIAVEEAKPYSIMTSYNLLNGVPTADSYDLCTDLAVKEWGFDGFIMTDWNGGSSTPSISMHAGNDLIMPGGKQKELNILMAVKHCAPAFDERGEIAKLKIMPWGFIEMLWYTFRLDKDGQDVLAARLGEGHTAEVKDGLILVDDEPLYTAVPTFWEYRKDPEHTKPMKNPLTTECGSISADGKTVFYRGTETFRQTICLGDIELRAKRILDVMKKIC